MTKINVTFFEDIAEEVRRIEEAMKVISNSGLTEKAIVLLVANLSKESQTSVRNVIYGLEHIGNYLIENSSKTATKRPSATRYNYKSR